MSEMKILLRGITQQDNLVDADMQGCIYIPKYRNSLIQCGFLK